MNGRVEAPAFFREFPKRRVADFLVNENAKMTMRPAVRPWRLYDEALYLLTALCLAAAHSPAQSSNHAGDLVRRFHFQLSDRLCFWMFPIHRRHRRNSTRLKSCLDIK